MLSASKSRICPGPTESSKSITAAEIITWSGVWTQLNLRLTFEGGDLFEKVPSISLMVINLNHDSLQFGKLSTFNRALLLFINNCAIVTHGEWCNLVLPQYQIQKQMKHAKSDFTHL